MKSGIKLTTLTLAVFLGLALSTAGIAQTSAEIVHNALSHADRPATDLPDDARRMPLEVLAFAGLAPGMSVFEMEAGGGWYTEILSRAVGRNGSVIMQNPPAFASFLGDAPQQRLANDRLPNVRLSRSNFDALDAPDGSVDMVTWILGPHELWFQPAANVSLGDPAKSFSEIVRVLKPGGLFLAVDHNAAPDSGTDAGGSLHRIREDIVTQHAEAAGLTVVRKSNLHLNEDDPLTIGVFNTAIQGRTSKFVVLYRK